MDAIQSYKSIFDNDRIRIDDPWGEKREKKKKEKCRIRDIFSDTTLLLRVAR